MSATGIVSMMNENPALQLVIDETSAQPLSNDDFNPKKHIDFVPPTKVHNMNDLKLPEGTGVSPFAVSEPFQLFTEEAVARMRAEIFSKAVLENCRYSSNLAQCQLRGFAAK
jgi:hypothetical protein